MKNILQYLTAFALFLNSQSLASLEKPRIAILQLRNDDAGDLETSVLSRLIRNYFVNTGRFDVLDREDMDKILTERAIGTDKASTDSDAVRFGKILNVQKIAIGTLMKFNGDFLLELRLVNVETSAIEKSATATCSKEDDFDAVAREIVEKIGGKPLHAATADSCGTVPCDADSSITKKEIQPWISAGLTCEDYMRFRSSGLSEDLWITDEKKSPVLAGLLGIIPVASGSYYNGNYGLAVFFTIAKSLSLLGITQTLRKEGENPSWLAAYATAYSACTVLDVSTAALFTLDHNRRLSKLSRITAFHISTSSSSALAITF